jgi:transposase-like protein
MPNKIDAAVKERALRMIADHRQDYPSDTALAEAVAKKLGIGRETVRRWLVQADVNAGARPGVTSTEHAEIRQLKAEVKRLREDNEVLRAATVCFAGAADSRGGGYHETCPLLKLDIVSGVAKTWFTAQGYWRDDLDIVQQ